MTGISGCCSAIFDQFTFADIRTAQPPPQRGVYIIRITHRGQPIPEIIANVQQLTLKLNWPMVTNKILNRIERLKRIGNCGTIYIGSAGTYTNSKNTLRGRYEEFAGRHTIMYPLWALLASEWELEYGWCADHLADQMEAHLKQRYKQQHGNDLPALVQR
jgi:hypothetical protein